MVEIASVSGNVDKLAARASMLGILERTNLCTIATVSDGDVPAASTAFYVLDEERMSIYVLTSPDTIHGSNIQRNGRAALNICSTAQDWTDAKRGVQIVAQAGLTVAEDLPRALELYLKHFPGLGKWVTEVSEIETKLESRFFTLRVQSCKLFDEPSFGSEIWIEVQFEDGAQE